MLKKRDFRVFCGKDASMKIPNPFKRATKKNQPSDAPKVPEPKRESVQDAAPLSPAPTPAARRVTATSPPSVKERERATTARIRANRAAASGTSGNAGADASGFIASSSSFGSCDSGSSSSSSSSSCDSGSSSSSSSCGGGGGE